MQSQIKKNSFGTPKLHLEIDKRYCYGLFENLILKIDSMTRFFKIVILSIIEGLIFPIKGRKTFYHGQFNIISNKVILNV